MASDGTTPQDGRGHPPQDGTPSYCQQAGGMHPTGMLSCFHYITANKHLLYSELVGCCCGVVEDGLDEDLFCWYGCALGSCCLSYLTEYLLYV